MGVIQSIVEIPEGLEHVIFGPFDTYMKKIERSLSVSVITRDGQVRCIGPEKGVSQAQAVFRVLSDKARKGETLTEGDVEYAIAMVFQEKEDKLSRLSDDIIAFTTQGKPIKPKTLGQKAYVDSIRKNMIVFGVGPAGTGKTYLAMAMAITAFKNNEVGRIIMTRPAIEAGEKLGFLPGDLQSKVDPYLRPLYDALYQIMGPEACAHNMEKGAIEVAPLAYMRGRTLDNAYIILDEAQNTTPAQMKMFLTRIGFGSKVVITGDLTQKDLPKGEVSGLEQALSILKSVEEIGQCRLTNEDVVRHPLVQKIVMAYEKADEMARKHGHDETSRPAKKGEHHDHH